MKNFKLIVASLFLSLIMASCMTLEHTVGTGAKGNTVVEKKQWYALWGAIPINKVDSKEMAQGATNYTIKSQFKFVDYVITYFTSVVTVCVQTVEVTK